MTRTHNLKLNPGSAAASIDGAKVTASVIKSLRKAATDRSPVKGLTHGFYRYPARFSPKFVASAVEQFSAPGQVVLDPYMGGGTAIVEAYARHRMAIGCDLNSLAVFVARSKVTSLHEKDKTLLQHWVLEVVPALSYQTISEEIIGLYCPHRTRNLSLPRARPAKKLIALAMLSLRDLPTDAARDFARAILLNVAQWALNNKKVAPSLDEIRARIVSAYQGMVAGLDELAATLRCNGQGPPTPVLIHGTASGLPSNIPFSDGVKADLVVTSPPYPGIHILYHRWQVDGRKETPAPYWIADCDDGRGASFYNFADREREDEDNYFSESLRTLRSIRAVMASGATMVQMIAFSHPRRQLLRYLANMHDAGFAEIRETNIEGNIETFRRIWRAVPSRTWYATLKGNTSSSREVVLLHRAA